MKLRTLSGISAKHLQLWQSSTFGVEHRENPLTTSDSVNIPRALCMQNYKKNFFFIIMMEKF